tara:strand:+ start:8679 stop:9716 length:1038 start_codon:yes stop_codon:yes gene_type:complete
MRVNSLDYLRGIMALGIMFYHYFSWTFRSYNSEDFLGRIGIYGVSIFYILSGLTLYIVYNKRLELKNVTSYLVKRFFRIFPLLWLSIFLSIFLLDRSYNTERILLNITGLYGFLAFDQYIPTGAWSIGNELVFYMIFPLIFLLRKRIKYSVEIFFIIALLIALYYAFCLLSPTLPLGKDQWKIYINPFNQILLFAGGVLIGKYIQFVRNNKKGLILLISLTLLFIYYPSSGNKISLVTQWDRLIFCGLSFGLTIAFLITDFNLPKIFSSVFKKLGDLSYSIYLLHPIVFWYLSDFISRKEYPVLFLILCLSISLMSSLIVYQFYEMKFIKLGKHLTSKKDIIRSH